MISSSEDKFRHDSNLAANAEYSDPSVASNIFNCFHRIRLFNVDQIISELEAGFKRKDRKDEAAPRSDSGKKTGESADAGAAGVCSPAMQGVRSDLPRNLQTFYP